jgi:two-component system, NarL family, sensor histidine kinase DevS
MMSTEALERELAEARRVLRQRDVELAASRQQAADLARELEETSRGLIAIHAELEGARQDAARLAAIVEWSDDAMFSMTLDAVVQTWNSGAERLLGYAAAEMVGQSAATLVPAELTEEFGVLLKLALTGELTGAYETRRLRKDGSAADVAVTCSAMRDASGEATGFSVVLRDITARLAAEADLAAARAQQDVLAERDRLARDLHDGVIQRVFGAGMSLQTAAGIARNPQASSRIEAVIADLDGVIEEIRQTIFTLRRPVRRQSGLRNKILALAEQASAELGFTPAVIFEGRADDIPDQVAGQVLEVCREALSNVARHARASAATVTLSSAGGEVLLRITDNGRGLSEITQASGRLSGMRERAEALGGTLLAASEPGAWTQLEWRVPLEFERG